MSNQGLAEIFTDEAWKRLGKDIGLTDRTKLRSSTGRMKLCSSKVRKAMNKLLDEAFIHSQYPNSLSQNHKDFLEAEKLLKRYEVLRARSGFEEYRLPDLPAEFLSGWSNYAIGQQRIAKEKLSKKGAGKRLPKLSNRYREALILDLVGFFHCLYDKEPVSTVDSKILGDDGGSHCVLFIDRLFKRVQKKRVSLLSTNSDEKTRVDKFWCLSEKSNIGGLIATAKRETTEYNPSTKSAYIDISNGFYHLLKCAGQPKNNA